MSKYYVELEDVIQRLDNAIYEANRGAIGYDESLKRLRIAYAETTPTIDIIHCGECKCCRDELIEEHMPLYIYCEKWDHETDFDSFCKYGERRDNE